MLASIAAFFPPIKCHASMEFVDRKDREEVIYKAWRVKPHILLLGETGAGKTSFVQNTLVTYFAREHGVKVSLYSGFEQFGEWLSNTGSKTHFSVFFNDETNLTPAEKVALLEGLFLPIPMIYYQGRFHRLSPFQKVILAGNPLAYKGRKQHELWQRHGGAVLFGAIPAQELHHQLVDILFGARQINLKINCF